MRNSHMPRQAVRMCMSRRVRNMIMSRMCSTACGAIRKSGFQGYVRITVNGVETYVDTLKEALQYANGKEAEITFMQSMENTGSLPTLKSGKITLDLNQKSLTAKSVDRIYIDGAEVTVKTEPLIL